MAMAAARPEADLLALEVRVVAGRPVAMELEINKSFLQKAAQFSSNYSMVGIESVLGWHDDPIVTVPFS